LHCWFNPLNVGFSGGGGMLDIGVYLIAFTTMVFGGTFNSLYLSSSTAIMIDVVGAYPSNIVASGKIGPTGVDEQAAISLSMLL
jgi:hypothetical protein